MVWGQRWLVVLLPTLSLIFATGKSDLIYFYFLHVSNPLVVSKIIEVYHNYFLTAPAKVFPTLYIFFVLATTLWCTLLMIYRILIVAGFRRGTEGRLGVYRRFIEVLVESAALYSISLILLSALAIRNDIGRDYLDTIAGIAKVCSLN